MKSRARIADHLAPPAEAAALIAEVRERRGWSRGDVARSMGVTSAAVRSWERSGCTAARRAELKQLLADAPRLVDVRTLRVRLDYSQDELAVRLGVGQSNVARWERGERVPPPVEEVLRELAEVAPSIVRAALSRLDCTQGELARLLGVSAPLVSKWVHGMSVPAQQERRLVGLCLNGAGPAPASEWIRERREALELTVRDLARRIGAQPASVGGWERGLRTVPLRYHGGLRRELGERVRPHELDDQVLGLVRSEPGLPMVEIVECFPPRQGGTIEGVVRRHVEARRLYRAKRTVHDRTGRPRRAWRFYPDQQDSEKRSSFTGAMLKKKREDLGWTRDTIARALGVTRGAVRSWEQGDGNPIPPARARAVIELLGGKRGEPPPRPSRPPRPPGRPSAMPDLFEQRVAAGLTQSALAKPLGVRQSTVSAWELGKVRVGEEMAERISDVLATAAGERMTVEEIRAGRERAGWTQVEFAKRLGVKPGKVRRWESGRSPVSCELWATIRSVLADAPAVERAAPMLDLREQREALRYSQREFARRVDVWQADVSRWEKGATVPPAVRERIERELAHGAPAADPSEERRAAILALTARRPGLSAKQVLQLVVGSWDDVYAAIEALKAAGKLHERPTAYTDTAGRERSRAGLYPRPAATAAEPTVTVEQVARRRERLGWSRAEFARRLGISQTIVFRWEHDSVTPSTERLRQAEQVLADGERELSGADQERLAGLEAMLKPAREHLELSVSEMARRLGVDRGTYAAWEARKRPVSSWRRCELLDKLDQLEADGTAGV